MCREEKLRDGDENRALVEDIRATHEVKDRPEMQLESVMVEIKVVQDYVMDHHEHMAMVEDFKDVLTDRFLGRE